MGVFDRAPTFSITLIDSSILDHWCAHPAVWEVPANLQHSRCVLAMVCYTLPSSHKGAQAIVYGASQVYIPTHQAWTNLSDALEHLKHSKEDCVVPVSMPTKPTFSLQPKRGKYYTMLPINGDPDMDHGPLRAFGAATLPIASREGHGDMAVHIKLLPCFGSSKWPRTELITEPVLSRGPLWKNNHFIQPNSSGGILTRQNGQPICQELLVNMGIPGTKLEYMVTGPGFSRPLTLMGCHPGWKDYLDLGEFVAEMTQCLMQKTGN